MAFDGLKKALFSDENNGTNEDEFYSLSKKFEYYNYNLIYEITQNLFRSIVLTIVYYFVSDIRIMIAPYFLP